MAGSLACAGRVNRKLMQLLCCKLKRRFASNVVHQIKTANCVKLNGTRDKRDYAGWGGRERVSGGFLRILMEKCGI